MHGLIEVKGRCRYGISIKYSCNVGGTCEILLMSEQAIPTQDPLACIKFELIKAFKDCSKSSQGLLKINARIEPNHCKDLLNLTL